jgi:hypothetical protein
VSSRWEHEAAARRARQWRPAVVIAGDPWLLDGFPRRPPITRAELQEHPLELHPVERTYDDFKATARAAFSTASATRGPPGR